MSLGPFRAKQQLLLVCRLLQSCTARAAPESPWLNNCPYATKHGPDVCAWLQVAAKQAALAALETQLGLTSASTSHNKKPLAQQLPVLQDKGQILVPTCRIAAKQAALAALETQLGSTNTSASQNTKPLAQKLPVSRHMDHIPVLSCRLLPSKLPGLH